MATQVAPSAVEEFASEMARASAAGRTVRIVGAATKLHWGRATGDCDLTLSTGGLDRIREHNAGDLTTVLEAGVPLARAQETFAASGQMLALDPWLGSEREATVGGVLATADSGPLSHRYGAPRDLVLGMTVVLGDGTVARSGGQVIKNVAGYDVAKLFCGSFGTLGVIATVNLRLHPRPEATATATARTDDPIVLARAARALAAAPLELEALDLAWKDARGTLLARCGGATASARTQHVMIVMRQEGLKQIEGIEADEELWEDQRAGQRSTEGVLVRVASPPAALAELLTVVGAAGARLVGRVALGLSYVTIEQEALRTLLATLPAHASWSLRDAPEALRAATDPWGPSAAAPVLDLMGRVKARFDPTRTCNPGLFVGGL
jgi:glycolate oxidase FAD binding subunit